MHFFFSHVCVSPFSHIFLMSREAIKNRETGGVAEELCQQGRGICVHPSAILLFFLRWYIFFPEKNLEIYLSSSSSFGDSLLFVANIRRERAKRRKSIGGDDIHNKGDARSILGINHSFFLPSLLILAIRWSRLPLRSVSLLFFFFFFFFVPLTD